MLEISDDDSYTKSILYVARVMVGKIENFEMIIMICF